MRTAVFSSLLLALALGASLTRAPQAQTPQGAQQTTPKAAPTPVPGDDSDNPEVVRIRLVRLPITVVDKQGLPVAGLSAGDFQILEDKRPQQFELISKVEELERLPVYVGVLMDTSASTAGKLKFEKEAALNFIHTVARLRKDKVAFVTFDHEVNMRQDFTDKLDLLDKAVNSVSQPGHHTSLYDAVWTFCDEKMRSVGAARRTLVIITDGDDTYSRATLKDAIDIAQRTETVIFAISTKGGFATSAVPGVEAGTVRDGGDNELVRLCEETGGRAFFTGDMLALERSFTRIAKEIRSQYIATYRPTNDRYDGSYRRIEVKLASGRDGLKVRAKRGYLAVSDTVR
jgi:Ca-activated chloride channel family protein